DTAIRRSVGPGIHDEHLVRILRIGKYVGVVPGTLPILVVRVDELPALAAVVCAIQTALFRLDERIDAHGIGGRCDADTSPDALRQTMSGQLLPGRSPVSGFEEPTAGTTALHDPWLAVHLPHAGIQYVRIHWIELHVHSTGPVIDVQHALPGVATVS